MIPIIAPSGIPFVRVGGDAPGLPLAVAVGLLVGSVVGFAKDGVEAGDDELGVSVALDQLIRRRWQIMRRSAIHTC
jgi:hypothetical protein